MRKTVMREQHCRRCGKVVHTINYQPNIVCSRCRQKEWDDMVEEILRYRASWELYENIRERLSSGPPFAQ